MPSYHRSFTYDRRGNRTTQTDHTSGEVTTYTYDAANQLTLEESPAGITTYTYDQAGRCTRQETPTTLTDFEYDALGRVTVAEPVSGPTTFTYNGSGQRVKKETPTDTTRYLYDFKHLLAEMDGSGETESLYTYAENEYGDLISQYDDIEDESEYFHYDAQWSTTALSDGPGHAIDRWQYSAFGLADQTQGTSEVSHTFVGKQGYYQDSELSLYLLGLSGNETNSGGRFYNPDTGRFLSPDPLGLDPDDLKNVYRYVGNNPVNNIDPSGLDEVTTDWLWGDSVYWTVPGDSYFSGLTSKVHRIGTLNEGNVAIESPYGKGTKISLEKLQAYAGGGSTGGVPRNVDFDKQQQHIAREIKTLVHLESQSCPSPIRQMREALSKPGEFSIGKFIYTGDAFANDTLYQESLKGGADSLAITWPVARETLKNLETLGPAGPLAGALRLTIEALLGEANEQILSGKYQPTTDAGESESERIAKLALEGVSKVGVPIVRLIEILSGAGDSPEEQTRALLEVALLVMKEARKQAQKMGDQKLVEELTKAIDIAEQGLQPIEEQIKRWFRQALEVEKAGLQEKLQQLDKDAPQRLHLEHLVRLIDTLLGLDAVFDALDQPPNAGQLKQIAVELDDILQNMHDELAAQNADPQMLAKVKAAQQQIRNAGNNKQWLAAILFGLFLAMAYRKDQEAESLAVKTGTDVGTGVGRDYVTYAGLKNGKPYVGVASAPLGKFDTADEIIKYRYSNDFSEFGGTAPRPIIGTFGKGQAGKAKARGTEQAIYQENVDRFSKEGVANLQNPVGPNNPRKDEYMKAAGVEYEYK